MLTQPALALGKRLRIRIHHFDRFRRRFHGQQQRVLDAGDRLGLDVHIVFHEEIEALPHGALQDVFKRDHAERTLASVHGGEGLPEVLARPWAIDKIPEQIHSREIRVRTLGAEIGHGYGTLKGTGRSENFMPDGTQMLLGQGACKFSLARLSRICRSRCGRKTGPDVFAFTRPTSRLRVGTAVEQGQQFAVHGVDLEAQPLKRFGLFRGCGFGPAVRGIVGFGDRRYLADVFLNAHVRDDARPTSARQMTSSPGRSATTLTGVPSGRTRRMVSAFCKKTEPVRGAFRRFHLGRDHQHGPHLGLDAPYGGERRAPVLIHDKDFVPGARFAHVAGLVAGHHRIGVHAARVDAERPRRHIFVVLRFGVRQGR